MSIMTPNGLDPLGTSVPNSAAYVAWLDDPNAIPNVLVEAVANVGGVDQTFYLSVLPFSSKVTDVPAQQQYRAVLVKEDIETTEQLSLDGSAQMTVGEVGINNADGAFDAWLTYVWTNRNLTILHGDLLWPRASYQPVFTGVSASMSCKTRDTVNLRIRDNLERLNVAISEHLLGGSTAQQGSIVPLGFGEIVNITPLLIDPTSLQYQVHDGAFNGLIEVRDNGVPIANDKIGWAAVTVDLAHGTFKLVSAPAGTITVSFQGDTGGGSYVNTVAGIVQRIATGYCYAGNRFTPAEIDSANFAAFDASHRQAVGIPVTGSTNGIAVIQEVSNSLLAQLTTSRAGLLQMQQLDFQNLVSTFDITPRHMLEQTITPGVPQDVSAATWLTFCQNESQQAGLQTSLPAEALSLLGLPYLESRQSDDATKALYKLTAEPTQEDTRLLSQADADAEALRRLKMRTVPRTPYQFDASATLFQLTLNQCVTVHHPRYNLSAGKTGIVVSLDLKWALGTATVGVMI